MDIQHRMFGVQSRRFRASNGQPLTHLYSIFSGRRHELDNDIFSLQNVVLLSSRSDPWRALRVQDLARARFDRYILSGHHEDLEQSILRFTEAIFLPVPWGSCPINVVLILYSLSLAIFLRAKEFRHPRDVKCCVTYLRYLREKRREGRIGLPIPITGALVGALAVQAELALGDADQDIEDMADLCNELLDSDISIKSLTGPIMAFSEAINAHFEVFFGERTPSKKVIRCLRKAITRLPDLHGLSITLAQSLLNRFNKTPSDDDYKDGMAILDQVINTRHGGPGGRPSRYQEMALEFAALFSKVRFDAYGKPEHLEQAIYRIRTALDGISLENPDRPMILANLLYLQGFRFDGSSTTANVQDVLSVPSGRAERPSFRDLTASLPELNDIRSPPETTLGKHFDILEITSIQRLTDIADIEDGVKYCRQLLASYPNSPLVPIARAILPSLFYRAFECTNEIKYLNDAITVSRDNLNIPDAMRHRESSLVMLISFLSDRLFLLHLRRDLNELMQLFAKAATLEHSHPPLWFRLSVNWSSTARRFGHPSTPTAYERAMSSMQTSVTFAPTLDAQHSRLIAMMADFRTLPLDYTSYLIYTGQVIQGIEALEQGRGLLWSEMRGLRTSIDQIDQIRLADSHLADKFDAINRDLETLTLAFSPSNDLDGGNGDLDEMDPFGCLVVRQRKLLDDREKIISQIHALPGFDTFLKPPSFETLRSAACRGPVIIVNHSKWRSDILILLHNSPPSLIATSHDFYGRANKLQDQLLGERKKGLESEKYEDALCFVLKELYDLVGRPVIERLKELNVPEQSRIWWCPTSVFCSLPLHAMGPIPSDVGRPRYFLDVYIPSYIPSLSALTESRKPGSQAISKPSILLVAQPDEKMPEALKEMKAVQAVDTQVTTLFSAKATPATVVARLRDHRFAHIACHGILEPGRPFESSFKLHGGKRLPLLDIVRSQLSDAEFAFLSACHSAELTDESIEDEVLHLAAAMQFCGFRSVVGTMWAMADTDGRDLARNFYQSVFSEGTQGIRYYERTAEALRDAVVKLRRKRGVTLERWVNYVHYGA
jgi:CHAT domain-containing protein